MSNLSRLHFQEAFYDRSSNDFSAVLDDLGNVVALFPVRGFNHRFHSHFVRMFISHMDMLLQMACYERESPDFFYPFYRRHFNRMDDFFMNKYIDFKLSFSSR